MPLYTVRPNEAAENKLAGEILLSVLDALPFVAQTPDTMLAALTDAGLELRVIPPPRLLDFPSANQALLHVARQAFDVKLVTSVSAAARLLAGGVKIETAEGEPVGVVQPALPPLQTIDTSGLEPVPIVSLGPSPLPEVNETPPVEPTKRRPGRPRKGAENAPPPPAAVPPAPKPAPEAVLRPGPGGEPPAASEALIEAEAARAKSGAAIGMAMGAEASPRKSLFERMSTLAANNSPALGGHAPQTGADREGAASPTHAAPEIAPASEIAEAGKQEGADQPKEEPAPSEDDGAEGGGL